MRAKDGEDELLDTPATVTVPSSVQRKPLDRKALGKSEEAEILLLHMSGALQDGKKIASEKQSLAGKHFEQFSEEINQKKTYSSLYL